MKLTKHSEDKYIYHGRQSIEPVFAGRLALGVTFMIGLGLLWLLIVGLGF